TDNVQITTPFSRQQLQRRSAVPVRGGTDDIYRLVKHHITMTGKLQQLTIAEHLLSLGQVQTGTDALFTGNTDSSGTDQRLHLAARQSGGMGNKEVESHGGIVACLNAGSRYMAD